MSLAGGERQSSKNRLFWGRYLQTAQDQGAQELSPRSEHAGSLLEGSLLSVKL